MKDTAGNPVVNPVTDSALYEKYTNVYNMTPVDDHASAKKTVTGEPTAKELTFERVFHGKSGDVPLFASFPSELT